MQKELEREREREREQARLLAEQERAERERRRQLRRELRERRRLREVEAVRHTKLWRAHVQVCTETGTGQTGRQAAKQTGR